jgi:hypothetical protein
MMQQRKHGNLCVKNCYGILRNLNLFFKLKDNLKFVTTELKSTQQIIRIPHEYRIYTSNPDNQDNLLKQFHKDTEAIKTTKLRSNNVSYKNEKIVKKKQKIVIMGDSNARGLAKEFKYRLNHEFEIQGIVKPGSTLANLVKSTCSDLKSLTKRNVCLVWGGTNDVGRNETNMGICVLNDFVNSHKHTSVTC